MVKEMKITKASCAWLVLCAICCVSGQDSIGDACTLHDGSKGVCQLDKNCAFVKDIIKNDRSKLASLVKCGFKDRNVIFCCKDENLNSRFAKVLCEGSVPMKPKKPVQLEDHILGGNETEVAEFPHFAVLGFVSEVPDSYDFNCGGTLIAERFVLTAAHCCNQKRREKQPQIVRLGKTSLREGHDDKNDNEVGQDIRIQKIILHEKYSSQTKLNDIALLQLEKPAKLAHNVWPACLSSKTKGLMSDLTIIGFGVNNTDTRTKAEWLLKGRVEEYPLKKCQEAFGKIPGGKPIATSQVCVTSPKSDTCQGDSGGPLEYKKNNLQYIYGITSYGLGCGSAFPSVYTRVDEYLEWIDSKMNL